MFSFSENISALIGYSTNQEYVKWFALIIGLDAISSISFAKLRALNKATRFALIRLVNIFINNFIVMIDKTRHVYGLSSNRTFYF